MRLEEVHDFLQVVQLLKLEYTCHQKGDSLVIAQMLLQGHMLRGLDTYWWGLHRLFRKCYYRLHATVVHPVVIHSWLGIFSEPSLVDCFF